MRRILITGASSGIGAATALKLDHAGADVLAGVRSRADGERALAGASDRLRLVELDVTDPQSIADARRQELEPEELAVVLIEPSAISTSIWDRAIERLDALMSSDDPRTVRYRDRLASFRETLRSADEHGKAPGDVADAIVRALTDDEPDTRYVVGASGKLATALRPVLSDRLADKLAERTSS